MRSRAAGRRARRRSKTECAGLFRNWDGIDFLGNGADLENSRVSVPPASYNSNWRDDMKRAFEADRSTLSHRRVWKGATLHPLEEIGMFFRGEGPVPDTFRRLVQHLELLGVPHIFMGATALGVHGFIRATEDVDVCMRRADLERFRAEFVGREYATVPNRPRRFLDGQTGATIDILVFGDIAGDARRQQLIRFPDPDEAETIQGTPVPSLARLIELKLVTWRYKDWGDVVELIIRHALHESFAERLHPAVRTAYLQCYDQKMESDRYDPERDDPPANNS